MNNVGCNEFNITTPDIPTTVSAEPKLPTFTSYSKAADGEDVEVNLVIGGAYKNVSIAVSSEDIDISLNDTTDAIEELLNDIFKSPDFLLYVLDMCYPNTINAMKASFSME